MRSNQLIIMVLSLIAMMCAADITYDSSEPTRVIEVDKAAIDVITSCYGNRRNTVGVGGIISGNLVKALSSQRIPVVLVNDSMHTAMKRPTIHRKIRYKLQVFVFATSYFKELKEYITAMVRTIWWNHAAYFFILYRSSQGCRGAAYLLATAWHADMINAKVICFDRRLGIRILGYNPYTFQAPEPWRLQIAMPYPKFKDNNFVVFHRSYENGKKMCKNLDFNKIKNLNGFPVYQEYTYRGALMHTGNEQHINNDADIYFNVLRTIISVLNGSEAIKVVNISSGNVPMTNYIDDMLMGIVPLSAGLYISVSRPFIHTGLVAMTQHSGHMSQLQKVISVVDIYTNIGVCVVLVLIALFFKLFVNQSVGSAILNTVRIVCNTAFMHLPQNMPSKLYLTTILLFAVTMQGIYQGNLASLLTTVVPFPNVNTWEDLAYSHYTIYIRSENAEYFHYPEFEGRVILLNGTGDCAKYVLDNSSVACVNFESILKDQAEELKLHLSEMLKPSLGVVRFRANWPLETQFNIILGKLFEADVIVPFYLRMNQKTLSDFNFDDDVKSNRDFRDITLHDLSFAFVILGIGLTCASVTFFIEIMINQVRLRIRLRARCVRAAVLPFDLPRPPTQASVRKRQAIIGASRK